LIRTEAKFLPPGRGQLYRIKAADAPHPTVWRQADTPTVTHLFCLGDSLARNYSSNYSHTEEQPDILRIAFNHQAGIKNDRASNKKTISITRGHIGN